MAVTHGKGGSVTFSSGDVSSVESWTLETTSDIAEYTSMASTNDYKTYKGGMLDWSASVTCVQDSSPAIATVLAAAAATLVLTDGAVTFTATATAQCVGGNVSTNIDDVTMHTYNFVGIGIIAMT